MSKTLLRGVLAVCLAFVAFSSASAQDAAEGLIAAIRPQLKDPAKPFTIVIKLKAKSGSEKAFEAAFSEAMKATRKEKGCLSYDLNRPLEDGSEYLIYERWANWSAISSHVHSAYITKLLSQLPELTEGSPAMQVLTTAGE